MITLRKMTDEEREIANKELQTDIPRKTVDEENFDSVYPYSSFSILLHCENKEQYIGFVTLQFAELSENNYDSSMEFYKLYIFHEYRNRGLGYETVLEVFKKVKNMGYKTILIEIFTGNQYLQSAFPFWEKISDRKDFKELCPQIINTDDNKFEFCLCDK